MPFVMLREHFPEIAEQETRSFTTFEDSSLPPGSYSLIESYCDEPDCDCRRVFFSVFSSHSLQIEAVIAYGWESDKFYARWLRDGDPETIRDLQGPILNPMSPQSPHAPAILDLVRDVVLRDSVYVERVKKHYRMFRGKIDEKSKQGNEAMAKKGPGRNEPCWCGSGKKYKKCHWGADQAKHS